MRRFLASLVLALAATVALAAQDVVLVLDNSGSMRPLDPTYRSRAAAGVFLDALPADAHVGLILFDHSVRLTNPLALADAAHKAALAQGLKAMDLRGQFTQSPSALEAAILELSLRGRPEAARVIVFATDGLVDTGSPALDRERATWMRGDLVAQAAAARIRIVPVAFTSGADLDTLGLLATRTGGEMVRAVNPEDLTAAYAQVAEFVAAAQPLDAATAAQAAARAEELGEAEKAALETLAAQAGVPVEAVVAGVESAPQVASAEEPMAPTAEVESEQALVDEFMAATPESQADPAASEPPASEPAVSGGGAPLVISQEERAALEEMAKASGVSVEALYRELQSAPSNTTVLIGEKKTGLAANPWPLVYGLVAIIVIGAGVLWRRRRPNPASAGLSTRQAGQSATAESAPEPEAFLLDLHGITDTPTRRITGRQLVVGRSLGTDTEHVDYFIVNKATVGRRHAIIKWKETAHWLVDLGSVNGTYVNDERLLGERMLRAGDRLRFHKFEFEFSAPGQTAARLDTRLLEEQTQLALGETAVVPRKTSRADITDPGDFQATGDFPPPAGVTGRHAVLELTELEADRDAFFSAPESEDLNFEPRRVAGDDDMTYDDRASRSVFETLARRHAGLDPEATVAGPAAGISLDDPDATQAGPAISRISDPEGTLEGPAGMAGASPVSASSADADAFFAGNTMTGLVADLLEDDHTFEVSLPVREEIRLATAEEMLATRVFDDASATGEFEPGQLERTLQFDVTRIQQADFTETDVFPAGKIGPGSASAASIPPSSPDDDDASGFFTDEPPRPR